MEIDGKVFVISGGASGLGEATARLLVRRGAKVILADVSAGGSALALELGQNTAFVRTDVTVEPDAQAAIDAARDRFGSLHGLVNCAGVAVSEKVAGRSGAHALDSFTRAVMINLVGSFNMLRLAAQAMMVNEPSEDGERGVIVNTASIAAYEGQIGQAAYAASKAGVVGMTLPAARELARSGIRVVTIAPGLMETPMMTSFPAALQESLAQSVPFPGRLGRAEEFASLVASVCELSYLNGETIRLDGALRMAAK